VSTEDLGGGDLGVSEVTTGLQIEDGWKVLDGIPCIMGGSTALVGKSCHLPLRLILTLF
jgi:hypothetical protein